MFFSFVKTGPEKKGKNDNKNKSDRLDSRVFKTIT